MVFQGGVEGVGEIVGGGNCVGWGICGFKYRSDGDAEIRPIPTIHVPRVWLYMIGLGMFAILLTYLLWYIVLVMEIGG